MTRILGDNPAVQPRHVLTSMSVPTDAAVESAENVSPSGTVESTDAAEQTPESQPREAMTPRTEPSATPTTSKARPTARRKAPSALDEYMKKAEAKDEWVRDYFLNKAKREKKRIKLEEERLSLLRDISNRLQNAREYVGAVPVQYMYSVLRGDENQCILVNLFAPPPPHLQRMCFDLEFLLCVVYMSIIQSCVPTST